MWSGAVAEMVVAIEPIPQERVSYRRATGLHRTGIHQLQARRECQREERVTTGRGAPQEEVPQDAEAIRAVEAGRAEKESVRVRLELTLPRHSKALRHHKAAALIEVEAVDRIHRRHHLRRPIARRQVVVEVRPGRAVEVAEGEVDSVTANEP